MGKVHISEDLKNKLDKVFNFKPSNISENDIPIGPAPKWQVESPKIDNLPNKSPEIHSSKYHFNYLSFNYAGFIFFTSIISGIGISFGVKLGRIIFW